MNSPSDKAPAGAMARDHIAVLRPEAIDALAVRADGRYVDATYGRGGHAASVLEQLGADGALLAIDRDPEAVADAQARFAGDARFTIRQANFAALDAVVEAAGWRGRVDGLLADLGVSSPQLDVAARGFGFSRDGALDMRMDPGSGESAAQWIARVDEATLADVLRRFGEERYARRIAAAIVAARQLEPIETTGALAEIVKAAHPRWERHHHPATRSFQAIRIAVNGELDALVALLASAANVLREGGRLAIISFHSLEDRLVKRAFRKPPPDPTIPRGLPVEHADAAGHPWRAIGKAVFASPDELSRNPRARSAVLRIAERLPHAAPGAAS